MLTPVEALLRLNSTSSQNREAMLALVPYLVQSGLDLTEERLVTELWAPLMAEAVQQGWTSEWARMGEWGVRQAAWQWVPDNREKPVLATLLTQGPSPSRKPDVMWHEAVEEGLAHMAVAEDGWSVGQALSILRQMLALADVGVLPFAVLDAFQDRLKLPLNDLMAQEDVPLARGQGQASWDWFIAHGGNPMVSRPQGHPLWRLAAQSGSEGRSRPLVSYTALHTLKPSLAALAWGQHHDPQGTDRLRQDEYFKTLRELAKELATSPWKEKKVEDRVERARAVLTQEEDWLDLHAPSGVPAAFFAVRACPQLLGQKNWPDAFWTVRCQPGEASDSSWEANFQASDTWWEALMAFQGGPMRAALKQVLAHVPLPQQVSTGWLLRWPHVALSNHITSETQGAQPYVPPAAWGSILAGRPELFWQGTPDQQQKVAHRWWGESSSGSRTVASLAWATLAAEDRPGLTIHPLLRGAVMALRLYQTQGRDQEQWVPRWIQGGVSVPASAEFDHDSVAAQLASDFPEVRAQILAHQRQMILSQQPVRPTSRSRPRA